MQMRLRRGQQAALALLQLPLSDCNFLNAHSLAHTHSLSLALASFCTICCSCFSLHLLLLACHRFYALSLQLVLLLLLASCLHFQFSFSFHPISLLLLLLLRRAVSRGRSPPPPPFHSPICLCAKSGAYSDTLIIDCRGVKRGPKFIVQKMSYKNGYSTSSGS